MAAEGGGEISKPVNPDALAPAPVVLDDAGDAEHGHWTLAKRARQPSSGVALARFGTGLGADPDPGAQPGAASRSRPS